MRQAMRARPARQVLHALHALTREVSPAIVHCELTHLARTPIDVARARAEHAAYEDVLRALGCTVERVPAAPALPDAVFVEDTAVVLDECAIVARPGAPSRRPETEAVAEALSSYRTLHHLDAPATLDGGDVLVVGRDVFVGASGRTNAAAVAQVLGLLHPYGYRVIPVPFDGCLHLKSAVTAVAADTLLVNRRWVSADAFAGLALVDVHEAEPFAANALRTGDTLVYPAAFPRTRERLEARGLDVRTVDVTELAKAEGAVTCCSLVFRAAPSSPAPTP